MRCHSCSAETGPGSRFCATCGAELPRPEGPTLVVRPDQPSATAVEAARFLPGTILGGRFRIVALLGRGGMGEVFRADDLKLGQTVALKFLPRGVANDSKRLERLHAEVRIARQVSHPNVCRVYDIAEIDGAHFLSMECVEGEDLSTLLRRIGQLPSAKAIQISRQIAAGVAAAHEKGILHRDLKPSNIMLDDRGAVRLTDFGLSALATELAGSASIEGTPAYMAPEQLAGEPASIRSDIYSLGLVMYEIFTGKRAFEADNLGDLLKLRHDSTPSAPSAVSAEIDPAVERIILRCLDSDPQNRPPSALYVANSLPGGDPLAAAIAAGETPSPDMLAAAVDPSAMRVSRAVACMVAVVLSVLIIAIAGRDRSAAAYIRLQPPEVLAARAASIARKLGYPEQPYRVYGFSANEPYLNHVAGTDHTLGKWERLRQRHPAPLHFWYRECPRPLIAERAMAGGRATESDPPLEISGEFLLVLDSEGALVSFRAATPERIAPATPRPIEWTVLREFAELSMDSWREKPPAWAPLAWGDTRAAIEGFSESQPDVVLRAEAAASAGRIVFFEIIPPWKEVTRTIDDARIPIPSKVLISTLVLAFLSLILGTAYLARRNFRLGRGDRRGAFRFAFALFILGLLANLLGNNHYAHFLEIDVGQHAAMAALVSAAYIWMFYIAIEPYVRRCWPRSLVSWNRVLLGRFGDPLVARHILVGLTAGTITAAADSAVNAFIASRWIPEEPSRFSPDVILGFRHVIAAIPGMLVDASTLSFALFAFLFIVRAISRSNIVAVTIFTGLFGIVGALTSYHHVAGALFHMLGWGVFAILAIDVGIVAAIAFGMASLVAGTFPMVLDPQSWSFPLTLFAAVLLIAVAAHAFRRTLAGRPVFTRTILET